MERKDVQFWVGIVVSIITIGVLVLQTRSMLREEARIKELESEPATV